MRADLRLAWRSLRRSPAFAIAALLTLAVGIGANTAILAVVHEVLLRPLPYPHADRLVSLTEYARAGGDNALAVGADDGVSFENFRDWRRRERTLERLSTYRYGLFSLSQQGNPEAILGATVSWDFFELTGTPPRLGRSFRAEEDVPSPPRLVVVSDRIWRQRLGASPDAIGRTLEIDGEPHIVVGVMGPDYAFPGVIPPGATVDLRTVDLWMTTHARPVSLERGNRNFQALGLLSQGVTLEQARADMERVARELETEYAGPNTGQGVAIVPLKERWVSHARPALLVLLAAIGCVLLVACANVANLILARGRSRVRELAVRAALGATRERLVRQLAVEHLVLAAAGGLAGLFVAWLAVQGLVLLRPANLPRAASLGINGWSALATVGLTVVAALLAGVVPALRLAGMSVGQDAPRAAGLSPATSRARRVLTAGQVAVSLALLVAAGLLLRSFARLNRVDMGFEAERVMTVGTLLPPSRYAEPATWEPFFRGVLDRLAADPSVESTATINVLPLSGFGETASLDIVGRPFPRGEEPTVASRVVTPGYFETLSIPIVAGRAFTARDDSTAEAVVIVSRSIASRFFEGDAVGRLLHLYGKPRQIVGVAGDVRDQGAMVAPPLMLYTPLRQVAQRYGFFVVKTREAPGAALARIRDAVLAVDPQQPLINIRTMASYMESSLADRRFTAALMAGFSALALGLAVVGLYSVIAYMVSQRTREIGIRMALGATTGSVTRLVLGQGLRLALAGVAVGLVAAAALSRLLAGLLVDVSPYDPVVYGGVSLLLLAVAAVASWVPARRAAGVEPNSALRAE